MIMFVSTFSFWYLLLMSTELVTLIKYSAISGPPKRRRREREKMPEQAERPMESKTSHTHTHRKKKLDSLIFIKRILSTKHRCVTCTRSRFGVFFCPFFRFIHLCIYFGIGWWNWRDEVCDWVRIACFITKNKNKNRLNDTLPPINFRTFGVG